MVNIGKIQRKAYMSYLKGNLIVAKCISRYLRIIYSCDISYKADVDPTDNFSHLGLGTVVGSGTKIGANTKILQNVSIGGRGNHRGPNGEAMPTIGHDVLVGAGACILGPITVGDNATIGANAVVLKDVPDNAVVVGNPAHEIKRTNIDE